MQQSYLAILVGAGIAFYLNITWLFFALIVLFIAILGSEYYSQPSGYSAPNQHGEGRGPAHTTGSISPPGPQPMQMAPPFVVTGRDTPDDIRHQMISTMMGQIFAADHMAARSTPGPDSEFSLRQYKWRQGPEPGTKEYYEGTFRKRPEEELLKDSARMQALMLENLEELNKNMKKDKKGH